MGTVGCRCSPPTPQPVTLRIVNTTRAPIYVDGTLGKLGLALKRDVNGVLPVLPSGRLAFVAVIDKSVVVLRIVPAALEVTKSR